MLTVVDRPVVQHVVDEAREAGIEHFVFVTGRNKGVIEDHFDIAYELDATLAERGKTEGAGGAGAAALPGAGQTSFTRQQAPLGLGHAVWCAREIVGDEPFALLLPDMLHHGPSCLAQMIKAYDAHRRQHHRGRRGAGQRDPSIRHLRRQTAETCASRRWSRSRTPGTAPSNLVISGRYILQPEIFDLLATPGARRRRRDPDHRRHDQAFGNASLSMPPASTARSTTAARSSAS